MRRAHQYKNYHLFTEPESGIEEMLEAPISGIFTGLLNSFNDRHVGMTEPKDIAAQSHGGTLLLCFSATNSTWVIESDQILRSIVTRRLNGSPDSQDFLHHLYDGKYNLPDYLKVKKIVDLSPVFGISGNDSLSSIRVLKLPDNYDNSVSRSVHSPHQCTVEFAFEDTRLLIGYQMDSTLQGHRFMTWDDIREDFPVDQLSVCLQVKRSSMT